MPCIGRIVTVPSAYFPFWPLSACTYFYCGSNKVVKMKMKINFQNTCGNGRMLGRNTTSNGQF